MMRVLVLGALPPPIGGVSIHIDRFLDYCWENDSENSIVAFDIKKRRLFTKEGNYGFLSGFVFFIKCNIVHIHISSNLKLFAALIAKLLRKHVVYTHHNSIVSNRRIFGALFRICDAVILVNSEEVFKSLPSLNFSRKIFSIPAFIAKDCSGLIPSVIEDQVKQADTVFSTNCYSASVIGDEEVYGISRLVDVFKKGAQHGLLHGSLLIICDPSASFKDSFQGRFLFELEGGNRILYWSKPLDFLSVIKISTATIRATITDGDSLSVRESLHLGVPVIASDCVRRPDGSVLYRTADNDDLLDNIVNLARGKVSVDFVQKSYADDVLALYRKLTGLR
tara:strand:+ start:384 stop:1391 length:1008 start_codon:yes stop_codon:yes gene_type:complete